MNFGENVTLVNRTDKPLKAKWDGRDYTAAPGETPNVPKDVAQAFIDQNPRMGTEHPYDPMKFESLAGIKGGLRLTTPATQSAAIERMDRQQIRGIGRGAKPIDGGGPTSFEARAGVGDIDGSTLSNQ